MQCVSIRNIRVISVIRLISDMDFRLEFTPKPFDLKRSEEHTSELQSPC